MTVVIALFVVLLVALALMASEAWIDWESFTRWLRRGL